MNNTNAVDKDGRRAGIDRRIYTYSGYLPERRSTVDRRSGLDRRSDDR